MLVVHSWYIIHCMLSLLIILAPDISSYHGFSLVIFFFVVVALLKLFFLFLDYVFTLCVIHDRLKWLMIIHGERDASWVSDSMVLIHISFTDDLWFFSRKSCCKTRHSEIISHLLLLSTSIFYNPVATSDWTGTTHPSGVPDFSPSFRGLRVALSFIFCLLYMFGESFVVPLSFVLWPLYCPFFKLRLLIALATSNLSYA